MLSKEWLALNAYERELLGKPNVLTEGCAVCGRPATNEHHVIFKGSGGMSRELERKVPKIRLCGNGNVDGCHGEVHHRRLFFRWVDGAGWQYQRTLKPTKVDDAMAAPDIHWAPLAGWEAIREKQG